jgi:hypothetical protein
VKDFGVAPGGALYLVMELLPGETLSELIEREPLPAPLAIDITCQVLAGLDAAHAAGVVHRDMKPANVLLVPQPDGRQLAKILDFGIAKVVHADSRLTRTGTFVGTPDYVAPEQAMGDEVDARADVYSVGVMLYQLVTGTLPFRGDNFMAVLHQQTMVPPEPPSRRAPGRNVSPALEAIILRCLEKQPGARFASAAELRAALLALAVPRRIETEPPRRRGRALPIANALLLVAGGAVAAAIVLARDGDRQASRAPPDAGRASDAAPPLDAAPTGPVWKFPGRADEFDYTVWVTPRQVDPGAPFRIEIEILPGPSLRAAPADAAQLRFVHYKAHAVAHEARPPLTRDRVAAELSLPEAGKHHVELQLLAGGKLRSKAGFDICIGADPTRSSRVCPRMKPTDVTPR